MASLNLSLSLPPYWEAHTGTCDACAMTLGLQCYLPPNSCVALPRYWETREQRTPTLKAKLVPKADQEQQDPLEFLQSDGEDDEKSGAQRRLQEQRERLHGALALIELANLSGAPLRQ